MPPGKTADDTARLFSRRRTVFDLGLRRHDLSGRFGLARNIFED